MSPLKHRKPTTAGTVKCNTCEAQDNDYQVALTKMLKVFKESMNKSINGICENTNRVMQLRKQFKRTK